MSFTSLLSLSPSRTHGLPGLPSSQPPLPAPKTGNPAFQLDPTQSSHPGAPNSHLPQLMGPVPHGGPISLSPAPQPPGPKDSKFGTPVPHSHPPLRPHPADPKTPREPPEVLSLTPSAVNAKDPNTGTPRVPQVRIPFSFPPSRSLSLSPAHSGMTQGMRTRLHLFPPREGKAVVGSCGAPNGSTTARMEEPVPFTGTASSSNGNLVAKRRGNASFVRNLRRPASRITPTCPAPRHVTDPGSASATTERDA